MGFGTFILSRDLLGHAHSINYRGSTTYNTYVGSILSICIYVLVLVQLVDKITDLVEMRDPTVSSLERPMFEEESIEFGDINLDEHRFNFGVYLKNGSSNEALEIPSSIGRILVGESAHGLDDAVVIEPYEAIKCT